MRALLFVALILGSLSAAGASCPAQYQLMEGVCIRPLLLKTGAIIIDNELPKYREECGKDDAHLPIIKNDEENTVFDNVMQTLGRKDIGDYILLDLVCNTSSHRLDWVDGTTASYSLKNTVDFNFDCVSSTDTVTSDPRFSRWKRVPVHEPDYVFTVMCVFDGPVTTTPKTTPKTTTTIKTTPITSLKTTTTTKPTTKPTETPIDGQCGDYSVMSTPTDAKKPCIKVFTDSVSWNQAEKECAVDFASLATINSAEENKFFWRTAISSNILDGMHIGAHQSLEDPSKWTWSDGEVPFGGKTYDNFMSIFPIPGGGECSSMATENPSAFWINEHCDENMQPFMCRRADFSTLPKACPTDVPKAGEDIFPPGFPNPDTACEYFLVVAANKLVELQVLTLVAEDNKDFFEILEGTSGPHLLANLTGTILTPTKYTTAKSNVLRVNWKPNGSGSGRGFRIRYIEVSP